MAEDQNYIERNSAHQREKPLITYVQRKSDFLQGKPGLTLSNNPVDLVNNPQAKNAESRDEKYAVPEGIRKRYLEAEGKFYYREAANKLAFEDRGARLHTEHNDPAIATSMVEIAAAKGWGSIKATGSDEFKREIWLQASLKNIDVAGFKPKDVDLAKLDEIRSIRMKNSIEPGSGREPASAENILLDTTKSFLNKEVPGEQIPDQFSGNLTDIGNDLKRLAELREEQHLGLGPDREKNPQQFSGRLLDHGEAHIDFDKKNEKSYFVKIETVNGSRIHWGEQLKKIVMQSPSAGKTGERIDLLPKDSKRLIDRSNHASDIKLEGSYAVAVAIMTDVLREKGYSARVLDKAVSEATRRLEQLRIGGKHAPLVKIYDKSAPRETVRERLKPSKSKQREAERNR